MTARPLQLYEAPIGDNFLSEPNQAHNIVRLVARRKAFSRVVELFGRLRTGSGKSADAVDHGSLIKYQSPDLFKKIPVIPGPFDVDPRWV